MYTQTKRYKHPIEFDEKVKFKKKYGRSKQLVPRQDNKKGNEPKKNRKKKKKK